MESTNTIIRLEETEDNYLFTLGDNKEVMICQFSKKFSPKEMAISLEYLTNQFTGSKGILNKE